jgi:AmmeMemoRadiSam system protein B/AmmeMemoRadiSam system protein A
VAGTFYPSDPVALARMVDGDLARVPTPVPGGAPTPKALIVPHAGYVYSGPTAAAGYARLVPARGTIRRVVLLGPAHRLAVRGMAVPTVDAFLTPLGAVPVDDAARSAVADLPGVGLDDRPHGPEHSLEVHLPFLQRVLGPATGDDGTAWSVLPVVVGDASAGQVAALLDRLWGGDETLIVVSSDLSHYHDHRTAQRLDAATVAAMTANRLEDIGPYDACGAHPVRGLLLECRRRGLHPEALDVRTSAETAGDAERVVGYAALAIVERDDRDTSRLTERAVADPPKLDACPGSHGPRSRPRGVDDGGDDGRDAAGLDASDRATLLAAARSALADHLGGRPVRVDLDDAPPALRRPGASFVTLRHTGGQLRGCIGTMEPHAPLLADVAANAVKAATRDPRFVPVRPHELSGLEVHVSVLSPLEPLAVGSLEALAAAVRPGVDGLLVEAGHHRGTFLPAVWEQLPDANAFLTHLWAKAGLPPGAWPADLQVWRYEAVDIE